jgi:hypothetical protein
LHQPQENTRQLFLRELFRGLAVKVMRDAGLGSKVGRLNARIGCQNRVDSLNESLKRHAAGHFNPLSIYSLILVRATVILTKIFSEKKIQQGKPQLVDWTFRSSAFVGSNLHHRIVAV